MKPMHYYNWRVKTHFEFKPETVEEDFDSIEMMKLIDKQYNKSSYMKKKEGL